METPGSGAQRSDRIESWVSSTLSRLTREEKVSLLAGADSWSVSGVERVAVPRLVMSDGPNGVRGTSFVSGRSVCFPCAAALAAAWDPDLVREVGAALGREARRAGVQVLLAPTVNLHRNLLGGRNFESFSEDPELASQLASAYMAGVQSTGVAACVKHFAGNESEFQRHTISSEVDERTLRELYLAPFEAAVTQGAWCVMAAYNRLNGIHASQHHWLLTRILREEWGFDGVVVSDWLATRSTVEALEAGLDVEMPGPPRHRGPALLEALEGGTVTEDLIDRSARRVLRLAARTWASPLAAAPPEPPEDLRPLAARAAARGIVLLKNDGLLPLDPGRLRRVALIGPDADLGQIQGGGSARVNPERAVGVLEALRVRLPAVEVGFERGCVLADLPSPLGFPLLTTPDGAPGAVVEYLHRDGDGKVAETAASLDLFWLREVVPGLPVGAVRVRVRGQLHPAEDGAHQLMLAGSGRSRLLMDGLPVLEQRAAVSDDAIFDLRDGEARGWLQLRAGERRQLTVEFEPGGARGLARLRVAMVRPEPPDLMDRAVALAAGAEVAVVVAGHPPGWETEGRDRPSFALPGQQDELVWRIAEANPRTVVVLNTGSPVAMPWVERVAAIVQLWFAGQEMGAALADVLIGAVNPSGKLPVTFPARVEDAPSWATYPSSGDGTVRYAEGLGMGYRAIRAGCPRPRFAFGHGLSFTSFRLEAPEVSVTGQGEDTTYLVRVPVTNTGARPGREVIQLYARPDPDPDRPEKELKAFAGVELEPGETALVTLRIPRRRLRTWSEGGWRLPQDPVPTFLGTSSEDLPFRLQLPPPSPTGYREG